MNVMEDSFLLVEYLLLEHEEEEENEEKLVLPNHLVNFNLINYTYQEKKNSFRIFSYRDIF